MSKSRLNPWLLVLIGRVLGSASLDISFWETKVLGVEIVWKLLECEENVIKYQIYIYRESSESRRHRPYGVFVVTLVP